MKVFVVFLFYNTSTKKKVIWKKKCSLTPTDFFFMFLKTFTECYEKSIKVGQVWPAYAQPFQRKTSYLLISFKYYFPEFFIYYEVPQKLA